MWKGRREVELKPFPETRCPGKYKTNEVVKFERHGEIAVVTVNSPPVNALSAAVRCGILEGVGVAIAIARSRASC